jgi:hypothetical protein
MRTERELLTDCLTRLNRTNVGYMVTGSMASNYWGIPRTTHDLDFVLSIDGSLVSKIVDAFSPGFFIQHKSVEDALRPPFQFNAIDEQSALKVDFWVLRDDPFEREAFARRLQVPIFHTPAWLTTAEDVILHKLFWNRLSPSDRQLQDAAGVWKVQSATLDQAYLKGWAAILNVQQTLNDLMSGQIAPKST